MESAFARGIFWSLWVAAVSIPIALLPVLIWSWGFADAALFTAYSVAIMTFYLSLEVLLIEGLPFANPPKPNRAMSAGPLLIAGPIVMLSVVALQWLFIFQSKLVTVGATAAFGGLAYLIARSTLQNLQVNVLHNLHLIASGRTAMFKEIE